MTAKFLIKGMMLFIPLFLASCNDEATTSMEDKCKIVCSVDLFESSNPSRTNTDPNNGFLITWASGDVIGIFPREGYQEPFEIPANQIGKENASFDGGYWDVKDGLQYNAYYPFDKRNFDSAEMKMRIPVTYIGQKQNGTSCDIGAFDYTYSDWGTASGGSISFDFHHIGAIAVFSLKYPATTTYTRMTLSVDEALIPLNGHYDLTAEDVKMINDEESLSTSISLELENCNGTAGETGVFYMMLPPMDLSNNEVTLTLTSAAGTTCTYSIEKALNVNKGKLYRRTGVLTESNVEGTVDGWIGEGSYYSDGIALVANAGELSSVIPENEKNTITSLKISGELNGTDIRFIREMAGRNAYGNATDGKLEKLDLSEASIVEGGDFYYKSSNQSYYTSNDVIGEWMFGQTNLTEIQLPKGITSIDAWALYSCKKLLSAFMYDKVVSIKDGAFSSDSNLSSVNIPSSVEEIGYQAFVNCSNLKSIEFPEGIKRLGGGAFMGCGFSSITIPASVESIGEGLFAQCKSLATVKLSGNSGYVGDSMFYGCTALKTIDIPDGIHTIGNYAFAECSNLYNVKIPNSVTIMRDGVFYNCDVLQAIELPENLTTISYQLFFGCDQLRSVNIPNGVEKIGREAFSNCRSLTSIEIPSSVTRICYCAFYYSSLTGNMTVPGSVKTIEGGAFGNTPLTSLELNEGIELICDGAFADTRIGSVTIPKSVTKIEAYAFRGCYNLESAIISGPTEIAPNVFYQCSQMESIWFYSSTPSENSDASMGLAFNDPLCVLRVPSGAYDTYYEIYGDYFEIITFQ